MFSLIMAIVLIGGNLNAYGDLGRFEIPIGVTDWGVTFNQLGGAKQTVTRSGTHFRTGANSCRLRVVDLAARGPLGRIRDIAAAPVIAGKSYIAYAWVYAPNANPIGGNTVTIKLSKTGGTKNLPITVVQCNGAWQRVEIQFIAPATETTYWDLLAEPSGSDTFILNGDLHIDDVQVFEFQNVIPAVSATVTPSVAKGAESATGSILVTGASGGVAPYEYSKDDGITYQSSGLFSNIFSGTYNVRVKDTVGTFEGYRTIVGVRGALFFLVLFPTNETSPGANNGSISVILINGVDVPFLFSKDGITWQSSPIFNPLSPGAYLIRAKDTFGNTLTNTVTISAAPVCALIILNVTIRHASGDYINDGEITVTATDPVSGGEVKYGLEDFDYFFSGSSVGFFNGLVPGTYTITARTSNSCKATATATITGPVYLPRFQFRFDQINLSNYIAANSLPSFGSTNQFKFVIEELAYTGAVEEIEAATGSAPVTLSLLGEATENPFSTNVIASELVFNFISKTDGQFAILYSKSERKYRGSLYLFNGTVYDLIWHGFAIPMLWEEPYVLKNNYEVSLTFTDQLADLSNIDFSDPSGNFPQARISVLKAIYYCVEKTGLDIEIVDAVNILAAGMDVSPANGFLNQAFINPIIYEGKKCRDVLNGVLKGCVLYQSKGKWHVDLISEKSASVIPFRVYDASGNYASSGEYSPRKALRRNGAPSPRMVFRDQSAQMKLVETYGRLEFDYKLDIENNVLANGKFEDIDLVNGQLKGWKATKEDVTIDSIERAEFGIERLTKEREGKFAFVSIFIYRDYAVFPNPNQKIILKSEPFYLNTLGFDFALKLSFDIYSRPHFTTPYIFFDFALTGPNGFYLQPKDTASLSARSIFKQDQANLVDGKYIRKYIDKHLSWETFDQEIYLQDDLLTGLFQLEFRFSSNYVYDVTYYAGLRAIPITDKIIKNENRRRVYETIGAEVVIRVYHLEKNNKAESLPDIVRPTGAPEWAWILKDTYPWPTLDIGGIVMEIADFNQSTLIDNVSIEYLPLLAPPIEVIPQTETLDLDVRPVLSETLLHGDIFYSALDDLGQYECDPNYATISRSYFSFASGVPIYGGWYRRNVEESVFFHQLMARMYRAFFASNRWKLTGTVSLDQVFISPENTMWEYRTGKVFHIGSIRGDLRNASAEIELIEILNGTPAIGEDPLPIEPPVVFREHSLEFSLEFS